jgi:DNA-binding CsgD family transcriptional regulator
MVVSLPIVFAMDGLTEREIHQLLDLVGTAGWSGNGSPFGLETIDALVEAVPADAAAYVEWRFGGPCEVRVSRMDLADGFGEAIAATCSSYALQDVLHAQAVQALRISDAVSMRTLRKSPFYAAVMRPSGMEHEIKLWLTAPLGHARYFELSRAPGRDFSDRERNFLTLLRPHLNDLRSRWERYTRSPPLTDRELDVVALVAEGLTNKQISRRLFISPATVRTHLEHVYDKLGVRTRAGAVTAAFRRHA